MLMCVSFVGGSILCFLEMFILVMIMVGIDRLLVCIGMSVLSGIVVCFVFWCWICFFLSFLFVRMFWLSRIMWVLYGMVIGFFLFVCMRIILFFLMEKLYDVVVGMGMRILVVMLFVISSVYMERNWSWDMFDWSIWCRVCVSSMILVVSIMVFSVIMNSFSIGLLLVSVWMVCVMVNSMSMVGVIRLVRLNGMFYYIGRFLFCCGLLNRNWFREFVLLWMVFFWRFGLFSVFIRVMYLLNCMNGIRLSRMMMV